MDVEDETFDKLCGVSDVLTLESKVNFSVCTALVVDFECIIILCCCFVRSCIIMAMSVPRGPGFAQMLKEGAKVGITIQIMPDNSYNVCMCCKTFVVEVNTMHVSCARRP